jgi:outer membrane protein assembly factor BamD (BamD/ComL family)
VDEARKQLGSGKPQAALSTLNRYHHEYPKGALGQEAMLLRIEALAQMGDRSAARTLATRFLNSQPSSPHRKRIESLVGKIDVAE